ncbi:MAG: hypothetical protein GC193_03355 [Cryomorphaceae bacterium]|nr:hypothetical protein [Cryomorphaceae bacterium]
MSNTTTHLTQTSVDIYGAARLGAASLVREVGAELSNITFVGVPVYDSPVIDQRIASANYWLSQLPGEPAVHERWLGYKQYELSNHLGNVTATLSDAKSTQFDGAVHYTPRITSLTDYYPFGAAMPGRSFSEGEYRYGFQGQETDDEIKGKGNSINYKYRMHDARIGRFFAVDPLAAKYPFYAPYSFSGNRVIDMIELEGLEPTKPELYWVARPDLELAWFGDLERTIIYETEGIHSNSAYFHGAETMYVSVTYPAANDDLSPLEYHFWDKGLDQWVQFHSQDIGMDSKEATELFVYSVGGAGLIVSGLIIADIVGWAYVFEEIGQIALEEAAGIQIVIDPLDLLRHGVKRSGRAVIGSMDDEYWKAAKPGDRLFHFEDDLWDELVKQGHDMWGANKRWLDDIIKHRDVVDISRPYKDIREGSTLSEEVKYLLRNGYKWTDDAMQQLIPK